MSALMLSASRGVIALALLCWTLVPATASAGGDSGLAGDHSELPAVAAGPPAPLQGPALACDGSSVAQVVGLSGVAMAQAPGQPPRNLACDDVVHACETLITSPGARVGLLADDVFTQVDTDSRLEIGGGPGVSLFLHSGGMRLIDTRGSGSPDYHVGTPNARISGRGGDAELQVGLEHTAAVTLACSHVGTLKVSSAGQGAAAEAGSCREADGRSLRSLAAGEPRIGLPDAMDCGFKVATWDDFAPGDVAAPPFGPAAFPGVGPAQEFRRQPCDIPGSACGKTFTEETGPIVQGGGLNSTGGGGPPPPGVGPALQGGGLNGTGGGGPLPPGVGGVLP